VTTSVQTEDTHRGEVESGERFEFGDNWAAFLSVLDENRIEQSELALRSMLGVESLEGKSFLDVGSGSGLSSLAARRLGASVYSFDYDPQSVACTAELKRRFFADDSDWVVDEGSVLDPEYMQKLGTFDIVYSWGVLHHTGDMWHALANVDQNVANDGTLFVALYNDQGGASRRWLAIKKMYNALPAFLRPVFSFIVYLPLEIRSFAAHCLRREPLKYFSYIKNYSQSRGMSWWHDKIDWIGGLPFEVSKPEEIFDFYRALGYEMLTLKTCAGGLGCNEYIFRKKTDQS
jgi:2-polyprenyl-6-hydroxyphenyl methylase/3-demethylubiquinone-9 3-methyltransferase